MTHWQGVNDLIATQVASEIADATKGVKDDISTLNTKVDYLERQLDAIKAADNNRTDDEKSVMIRNFVAEDEAQLPSEIWDLFQSVLEVSVQIDEVTRFKSFGKWIGPVKVVLGSKQHMIDVLTAKKKLAEYEGLDKVRIEHFKTKQEVIARDNWAFLIRMMGDEGKTMRIASSGRIMWREPGEKGLSETEAGGGEKARDIPTTSPERTVPGQPGDPDQPAAAAKSKRKRKKKNRHQSAAGGTNGDGSSHEKPPQSNNATGSVQGSQAGTNVTNGQIPKSGAPGKPAGPAHHTRSSSIKDTNLQQAKTTASNSNPVTKQASGPGRTWAKRTK